MNVRKPLALCVTLFLSASAIMTVWAQPDPWSPARRLLGRWQGTVEGKPGEGTVEREYVFTMNSRYIRETNTSRYPAQPRNPKGETHEHVGMISFDRSAKTLVLRQFHIEGFVNTYRQALPNTDTESLVFESEAFENLPVGWKARETYRFAGPDEFTETFELAPPGKPFETYSKSQFKRVTP